MPEALVAIVGGGASGLSAAGALRRRGIQAVVLEQDPAIGGTWMRRYDRLRLHTVRQFSGLAHWPIPRRFPRYLARDEVVAYLRAYADHFNLDVKTGVTVLGVAPDAGGGWTIDTSAASWRARVVVIATGQYRVPNVPPWPGRERFTGAIVHSSDYRNATPFAGRRVLVVGLGNSGAEIATDLIEGGAASVAVSVRTPPTIVPRDPFGFPVQRTSLLLSRLPAFIANRIGRTTARLVLSDLSRFGMPTREFTPYSTRQVPLIDVGFVEALKRGRLSLRPALERLGPSEAIFADGREEAFDAIVAATGFTTGLQSIVRDAGVLDGRGEPIAPSGAPTSQAGLYFVGYVHSLRGHLFEANVASRRLARAVEMYLREGPRASAG